MGRLHLEDLPGWTSRLSAVSVGLTDPPLLLAFLVFVQVLLKHFNRNPSGNDEDAGQAMLAQSKQKTKSTL